MAILYLILVPSYDSGVRIVHHFVDIFAIDQSDEVPGIVYDKLVFIRHTLIIADFVRTWLGYIAVRGISTIFGLPNLETDIQTIFS